MRENSDRQTEIKNAVIVSEEIIPGNVWEGFCAKVGAKPLPKIAVDRSDGKLEFYEDTMTRRFELHVSFVGTQSLFEMNREGFLVYMERTFHESVSQAMKKAREDLAQIQAACAREKKADNEKL